MAEDGEEVDETYTKGVSSLRSQFEALTILPPSTRPAPGPKPSHLAVKTNSNGWKSTQTTTAPLDIPRPTALDATSPHHDARPLAPTTKRLAPPIPKPRSRPLSMMVTTSPPLHAQGSPRGSSSRPTPRLCVSSPTSPPTSAHSQHASFKAPAFLGPADQIDGTESSWRMGHDHQQHAHGDKSDGGEHHLRKSLQALDLTLTPHHQRAAHSTNSIESESRTTAIPPAVNRAAKPRALNKDLTSGPPFVIAPISATSNEHRKVSPFNTPPDSDDSSPEDTPSENPSPPPLPLLSKPIQSTSNTPSAKQFAPPPTHHTMAGKRRAAIQSQSTTPQRSPGADLVVRSRQNSLIRDAQAPGLPARRQQLITTAHPNVRESIPSEPMKRSALSLGFSAKSSETTGAGQARRSKLSAPGPPKIRSRTPPTSVPSDGRRDPQRIPNASTLENTSTAPRVDSEKIELPQRLNMSAWPDSSRANRRPPTSPNMPRSIHVGYDTKLFDVCGDLVCATGFVTRVWNLLTGKLLLSISHANATHGDTVKVTALCFKPARKIEDDGARLWLGTNWGEMLEIDIASKRITHSNAAVHNRREIVNLLRHGTDVWSLDEEGKLYVWPPDDKGTPDMSNGVANGRVPRRATTSTVIGEYLWLAYGKEIRVIKPSAGAELSGQQASPQKAILHAPGEVSSAATIIDQPDKVYFGQSDGKICIFSCNDYRLLEVISVGLYKIGSLIGTGSFLWCSQSTGTIFVFDTRSEPWLVKKEWPAHDAHISGIMAERNSLWKLSQLPVVSLGSAELRIWDGLLEDDWLEDDMVDHESEYCDFKRLKSLVVTWNVGASKPTDLRYDEEDNNFFRELLATHESADIVAFGLQELVDLEDKKLTAKNFFKSKHKDVYGQEQLGSVYRAWRDHLSRCLEELTYFDEPYTLLNTASLVGLFSCIFIKSSLKARVKDVEAGQIKTGMGGLHGNKGAIVVRLLLDDSSISFVNCHLAAGQNQTVNRNNDIASILETTPLSPVQLSATKTRMFTAGGDGSMIMDSESCVLSGDLNYRIDAMSRDTIISSIKQNNVAKALERDQLLLSRHKYPGFRLRGFNEGQITFVPTYKYDLGSDTYDTSEKRRAPAWCDRILYRGKVTQLEYRRHEVRVSDHRPVSSRFEIKVKTIRQDLRAQCVEQSQRRFEYMKKAISNRAKLDYLHEVFGLSADEGRKLLDA